MLQLFKFKSEQNKKIWVTADTHFGHNKIWITEKRNYKTIEEHDTNLIKIWNDRVGHSDTVLHLGDFMVGQKPERIEYYLNQLNGHIFLFWGNHTSGAKQLYKKSVKDQFGREDIEVYPITYNNKLTFVGNYLAGFIDGQGFVASHFAHRIWDNLGDKKPVVHICGHSHSNDIGSNPLTSECKRLDIGVDNFLNGPVLFSDVMKIMNEKQLNNIGDHHARQN